MICVFQADEAEAELRMSPFSAAIQELNRPPETIRSLLTNRILADPHGFLLTSHARPDGDTYFAVISTAVWQEVARVRNPATADDSADFSYVTYRRRKSH